MFGLSMFIYLLNTIFDVISIFREYPFELFSQISDFLGNLPILIFLVIRVILDARLIKLQSLNIFFFGSIIASTGFVIVAIMATRLAVSQGYLVSDFLIYLPFLIETILIMFLLLTLYIIYMEITFRYYILALLTGFAFLFLGDAYQLFYGIFGDIQFRGITRTFNLLGFSYLFAILIWVRGKKLVVSSITQIEEERKRYKALYLELDDKVRDLLILTQLLRHDLGNDIIVISNALELYKEKKSTDLLEIASKRLNNMEDRITKLRSSSEIYTSLRTEKIPVTFINEVAELFDNVTVKIKDKNLYIWANQLINFILFNIIENAFKHGGDGVNVTVNAEKTDHSILIEVIDDGIGIDDSIKSKILEYSLTITEKEWEPQGVGLSLAKNTIESFGGSFSIKDNTPKGSIVVMEFPLILPKE
jgi:signal transduction histidine kinase